MLATAGSHDRVLEDCWKPARLQAAHQLRVRQDATKRRVRSMNAQVFGRQLSSSTPTPKCSVRSAMAVKAAYSAMSRWTSCFAFARIYLRRAQGALDPGEFLAEVFDPDAIKAFIKLQGLLANEFKSIYRCC